MKLLSGKKITSFLPSTFEKYSPKNYISNDNSCDSYKVDNKNFWERMYKSDDMAEGFDTLKKPLHEISLLVMVFVEGMLDSGIGR